MEPSVRWPARYTRKTGAFSLSLDFSLAERQRHRIGVASAPALQREGNTTDEP